MYRGGAVFGSGVPGGSRQATAEEIEAMRHDLDVRRAGREETPPSGADADDAAVSRAADNLIEHGYAVVEGPLGLVHARIIRFWRGDSILELTDGRGRSRTRIPRNPASEHRVLLSDYISRRLIEP